MNGKTWIGIAASCGLALSALGACGDETSSTSSAQGTQNEGGSAPDELNGCTDANTEDMTGMAAVTITFAGTSYDPPCIRVDAGTVVTFSGSFSAHPLQGGIDGTADSSSDIPATSTGTTVDFTPAAAGEYPYYCTVHQGVGMEGAIFVE